MSKAMTLTLAFCLVLAGAAQARDPISLPELMDHFGMQLEGVELRPRSR